MTTPTGFVHVKAKPGGEVCPPRGFDPETKTKKAVLTVEEETRGDEKRRTPKSSLRRIGGLLTVRDKTKFGEVVRFPKTPAKPCEPPKFDPDHEWIRDERYRAQRVVVGLLSGRLWCINGRKLAEPPSPRDLQFFEEEGEDE